MPEDRVIERPPTGVLDGTASRQLRARLAAVVGARGTRRRRSVVIVVVALVVLGSAGLVTGLTLRHLDRQYGPLQGGTFFGLHGNRGFAFSKNGYSFHLKAAPNATAQLIASLQNLGAHSVKVTSIETDQTATKIQWSVYRVVNGGSVEGVRTPWRAFPAIIPAHGAVRVLITIHRPSNCDQYPKIRGVSQARYLPTHWVRWESLLHDHRTLVALFDDGLDEGIQVC